MIWFNPKLLVFDVGFELSFLATLGILYLAPRLNQLCQKFPNFLQLRDYLTTTLSAQFAVLPLILYRFETFSLIAPLANILVLPIIPLAMLIGFLSAIGGFLTSAVGEVLAIIAEPLLSWPIYSSQKLACLSFFWTGLKINLPFALGYGFLLWMWLKLRPSSNKNYVLTN